MKQKPFIIGIAGGSGAGKTTFVHQLIAAFDVNQVCVISQDDYYKTKEEQFVDENGIENLDLPTAIHHDELARDLRKLISGERVSIKEYVFNNEKAIPTTKIFYPRPIIVVEGLFVFHYPSILNLFDLKIFIDTKDNLKVIRRIKRDQIERNYPLEDVLYRYEHHVMPSFEKFILPYKSQADIVIHNNDGFNQGFDVVVGFMKNYLKS